MKNLTFNEALSKAQNWVGNNDIYAVGESLDENGTKVILVFASDTTKAAEIIPKTFHGHNVFFYTTGVIVPQSIDQEE